MKVKDYLECCCGEMTTDFFVSHCGMDNPEEEIAVLGYDDVTDLANPSLDGKPIRFLATVPVEVSYGRNAEVLPTLFKDGKKFAYVDLGDITHAWKACPGVEGKEEGQFYSYIDGTWTEVDEIW